MDSKKLLLMVEIAMMSALGFVLGIFAIKAWAYGGSISLEMLPIIIMALRRGLKAGLATGLLVGILQLTLDPDVVHPIQVIMDYPLPFLLVGLAGVIPFKGDNTNVLKIGLAVTIGVIGRFLSHFASGIIWWGQYAPEGTPVAIYSFTYNISYLLPSYILVLIVTVLLGKLYPKLTFGDQRFQLDMD